MNLKEIRDDVRSLIIEPTPGFRSDVELNRWINQAHQDLGMEYRIDTYQQIELIPGVRFYDNPDDLLNFKGAWTAEGKSIPIVPATSGTDMSKPDGADMTIFRLGKIFAITPPPEINGSIYILYERYPKQLRNDDDVPDIAEPYHRLLVAYATMRALQKDEDYEAASFYSAEYQVGRQLISMHNTPVSKDIDRVLELVRAGVLNAAEAAEWLNIPLKTKVWNRVEVEEKGLVLLSTGAISKADLIKNTEFTDTEEIQRRLEHTLNDMAVIPGWEEQK